VNARPFLMIALALPACATPPHPAEPAPPVAMAAPAPSAAPTPPATAAVPAEAPPSARVAAIAPSKEGAGNVKAKILFSNPSARACRVLGYKLTWAGKSKAITLADLTLAPGEVRERWLKVGPDDGDVAALTPESGRIEVQTDCGAH
jgi:hypothetical protein